MFVSSLSQAMCVCTSFVTPVGGEKPCTLNRYCPASVAMTILVVLCVCVCYAKEVVYYNHITSLLGFPLYLSCKNNVLYPCSVCKVVWKSHSLILYAWIMKKPHDLVCDCPSWLEKIMKSANKCNSLAFMGSNNLFYCNSLAYGINESSMALLG